MIFSLNKTFICLNFFQTTHFQNYKCILSRYTWHNYNFNFCMARLINLLIYSSIIYFLISKQSHLLLTSSNIIWKNIFFKRCFEVRYSLYYTKIGIALLKLYIWTILVNLNRQNEQLSKQKLVYKKKKKKLYLLKLIRL